MAKWLASSASPPWWIWVLLAGSVMAALCTAFTLTAVSIPLALVGLGSAIYATSRYTKPRYLVVEDREMLCGVVVDDRPALARGNQRELPGADQRPALRG